MRPHLRLFTGEEDDLIIDPPTQTISLAELLEVLEDAMLTGRTWLRDFRDDEIQIPEDLYEVIHHYRSYRTGA